MKQLFELTVEPDAAAGVVRFRLADGKAVLPPSPTPG
jgi:hypothetical protein